MTLIPVIPGREGGRVGLDWEEKMLVEILNRAGGDWGGGGVQDSTSLHGFHVEEIHLLELINI